MDFSNRWMVLAVVLCSCALLVAALRVPAAAADGAKVYATKCKGCHGVEGKGDGPAGKKLKPPASDLTNASTAKLKTADEVTNLVKKGGRAVGLAPIHRPYMKLSDDEVSALVKFVVGLRK